MDDTIERGLVKAEVRAERGRLGWFQLSDLRLELRAHADHRHRTVLRGGLAQWPEHRVRVADIAFVEIRDDELRQERQESVPTYFLALFLIESDVAQWRLG